MQAASKLKLVNNNIELGKKFPKEVIPYLLRAAENADAKLKIEIENQIVKIGESAISVLVESLSTTSGASRGVAAMSLIRMGFSSIKPLILAYHDNKEYSWIVDYIINEIQGSNKSLSGNYESASYKKVVAC